MSIYFPYLSKPGYRDLENYVIEIAFCFFCDFFNANSWTIMELADNFYFHFIVP